MASEPIQVVYCPVCGEPKRALGSKLYGVPTCRKCIDGFARRRSLAWIIDLLLMRFPVYLGLFCLLYLGDTSELWVLVGLILSLVGSVTYFAFFVKDGFNGYSPGKFLLGLQVYNRRTGRPTNFIDALVRSALPALVPIIALIIGVQLRKGPRIGDGVRDTKVIWLKYAHSPVFNVSPRSGKSAPSTIVASPFEIDTKDTNPYRAPQG